MKRLDLIVSFEVTRSTSKAVSVTEEEFERIKNGEMPFFDSLREQALSAADTEACDYKVTDKDGCTIIDWD